MPGSRRLCYRFRRSKALKDARYIHLRCILAASVETRRRDLAQLRAWADDEATAREDRDALDNVIDELGKLVHGAASGSGG
eukprot:819653-Pyramimonas_sp.AAC.1